MTRQIDHPQVNESADGISIDPATTALDGQSNVYVLALSFSLPLPDAPFLDRLIPKISNISYRILVSGVDLTLYHKTASLYEQMHPVQRFLLDLSPLEKLLSLKADSPATDEQTCLKNKKRSGKRRTKRTKTTRAQNGSVQGLRKD